MLFWWVQVGTAGYLREFEYVIYTCEYCHSPEQSPGWTWIYLGHVKQPTGNMGLKWYN